MKQKTKTPWQKAFNPNYLGSWSLADGEELTTKVTHASIQQVRNQSGTDDKVVIHLEKAPGNGIKLPMIIGNKESARAMEKIAKSPYIEDWVGAIVTIYVKQGVKAFGGGTTEALRIKAPAAKKRLDEKRFDKMVQAIESGNYLKLDALERFSLTDAQRQQIQSL